MLQSTVANRPDLKPDLKILGQVPPPMRSLRQAVSLAPVVGDALATEVAQPVTHPNPPADAPLAGPRTRRRRLKRTLVVIDRPTPTFASSPRERAPSEPLSLAERARMQLRSQRRSVDSSAPPTRPMRASKAVTPTALPAQRITLRRPLKLISPIDTTAQRTAPEDRESVAAAPAPAVTVAPIAVKPAPKPSPPPAATLDKTNSRSLLERLPFGLGRLFAKA